MPGWLRVDTVHQGDPLRHKGVYHINAVDTGAMFSFFSAHNGAMPARCCRVSFIDAHGGTHAVEVTADSLFEAVAVGLHDLRASGLTDVRSRTAITVRLLAEPDAEWRNDGQMEVLVAKERLA